MSIIILNQVNKSIMKKLFFAISFLAITAAAFAGNSKKALTPEMRLDYAIRQQVAVPHIIRDTPGEYTAEVHFRVNPDGSLTVGQVVSDQPELTENLLNQIKGFTVNTTGLDLSDTYKVALRFNIQ